MLATCKKSTGSSVNMLFVVGQPPMIFVEDVSHIEQLLTDKECFNTRGKTGFDFWVPQGLLALETGPQWSLHRQLVSRCLTTNFLKTYTFAIQSKCRNLLKALDSQATLPQKEATLVDVQPMLVRTALDIIASVCFGIEFDALNTDTISKWTEIADIILDETLLLTILPPFLRFVGGRRRRFNEALAWAREQLAQHEIDKKGLGEDVQATMIAQLRRVKDTEGLLTEEEIMQEVLTMGGAGHETTANTLSWALFLLATHPKVQADLLEELESADFGCDGDEDDVPSFETARSKLPLTLAVVYETLRLYPTVPLFPRECSKHGVRIGGFDVPKGSSVVVVSNSVHRDARYFTNPDHFIPSRFLGVSAPSTSLPVGAPGKGQEGKFAFMPFGAGQRTCVGQRFAILEAMLLLSAVVKRFHLSPPPTEGKTATTDPASPGAAGEEPTAAAITAQLGVREHLAITLRPIGLKLVLRHRSKHAAIQTQEVAQRPVRETGVGRL